MTIYSQAVFPTDVRELTLKEVSCWKLWNGKTFGEKPDTTALVAYSGPSPLFVVTPYGESELSWEGCDGGHHIDVYDYQQFLEKFSLEPRDTTP